MHHDVAILANDGEQRLCSSDTIVGRITDALRKRLSPAFPVSFDTDGKAASFKVSVQKEIISCIHSPTHRSTDLKIHGRRH